jgi:L-aminopeptidase/D-esterase-like protein
VNALGDVVDPDNGSIIAGVRDSQTGRFAGAEAVLRAAPAGETPGATNTVIGVVATNAPLTKEQASRLADVAHDGIARAIRPSHTLFDGDTIFALSLPGNGIPTPDPLRLCAIGGAAAEAVSLAIVRAVRLATSMGGVLSAQDLAAAR